MRFSLLKGIFVGENATMEGMYTALIIIRNWVNSTCKLSIEILVDKTHLSFADGIKFAIPFKRFCFVLTHAMTNSTDIF